MLGSIGRSHLFGGCNRVELRDPESQKRQDFVKSVDNKRLEGSSTWGKLGLEGLLLFVYSHLFFSCSIYHLESGKEDFPPSSSVFFLITHQRVILCLYSSSLFFQLSFYCCDLMNMAYSSYIVCSLTFTLFRTQFRLE